MIREWCTRCARETDWSTYPGSAIPEKCSACGNTNVYRAQKTQEWWEKRAWADWNRIGRGRA